MVAKRLLARNCQRILIVASFSLISMKPIYAASYEPTTFFPSVSGSYDVASPTEPNEIAKKTVPIEGLLSGRLSLERGLFAPAWSHWIEFGYHSISTSATYTGTPSARVAPAAWNNKFTYMSILPLGVTYWVARTSYIDFGCSAAGGFGFSPKQTITQKPELGAVTETKRTGGVAPIFDVRVSGRFWFSKYFGITASGGFRYFKPSLRDTSGTITSADLMGVSVIGGMTFAIGGLKRLGHNYVEVLKEPAGYRR